MPICARRRSITMHASCSEQVLMQQSVCSTERGCFHTGTGNTLCGYHACKSFGTGAHASKMSPLLSGLFPMQGRVTPFVDMRIVDDDGQELPRDGRAYGDLQVRGPHVIQRYYRVSLYHCCIPGCVALGWTCECWYGIPSWMWQSWIWILP